jgi:uncharacterized protein (TIGR03083 family)
VTAAESTGPALTAQLAETWVSIDTLAQTLTPEQWASSTDCPGWTVRDHVAHLVGTESMLAGHPAPPGAADDEAPAHVRNDIGRLNELWVAALRGRDTADVLAEFRRVTGERLEALRRRPEEEWDAPSWTPVGQDTYRRFMQIRVFDCWVHEQDVRRAVGRPGHLDGPAAEQAIDEIERSLGYVVGKKVGAPDGSRLTIELSGPVRRVIHVAVDGRAAVVRSLDRAADVTIHLDSGTFAALACGRADPAGAQVSVAGDRSLGRRLVDNLAFTI